MPAAMIAAAVGGTTGTAMMTRVSTNQAAMARCQLRARQPAIRSRSGACGGRCRQT